jgi:hypothetical protein
MAERQHFGGPGRQMSGEMPSSSSSPPSSGVSLSPRESSVTFSLITSPTGRTDDLNGTTFFPKTEPADSELGDDLDEDAINIKTEPGEGSSSVTTATGRRPRGRPRKSRPESLTSPKSAKGRSKTGCFTCRKRKKKCDERKPACKNCEQNNVVCEGYPPLALWQGGRERKVAQSTSSNYHFHYACIIRLLTLFQIVEYGKNEEPNLCHSSSFLLRRTSIGYFTNTTRVSFQGASISPPMSIILSLVSDQQVMHLIRAVV